jgi:tetratricopeptide (TPR) repeat protein
MKELIVVFTILLTALSLNAQEGIADQKQFNAAVMYHTQGDYDDAIAGFSRIINAYPDYVKGYFFRGYSYLKKKDFENALGDFKIVAELEPKNHKAFFYTGKAYYSLGQYDEAIEYFNKTTALNPKHVSAINDKGMAYFKLGKYDEAIISFKHALELDPKFAMAHNNIGSAIYFNQNVANPTKRDLERARDAFGKAIEINPTLFIAYYNRSSMFYFLKDYDAAYTDILKAIQIQPENGMCYFYGGVTQAKMENHKVAIYHLKEALDLIPTLHFAYEEMGNIYLEQEKYIEAIEMYEKAAEMAKSSTYTGLMYYYIAIANALQEDETAMYTALKKAHSNKVFKDKKVYQAFLKEKSFKAYRRKKDFQKIAKKASKGKKDSKFEDSELSWFRMEN